MCYSNQYNFTDLMLAFDAGMFTIMMVYFLVKNTPTVNWHKKYHEIDTCKCDEVDYSAEEKQRWLEYDENQKVDGYNRQFTSGPPDISTYGELIVQAEGKSK